MALLRDIPGALPDVETYPAGPLVIHFVSVAGNFPTLTPRTVRYVGVHPNAISGAGPSVSVTNGGAGFDLTFTSAQKQALLATADGQPFYVELALDTEEVVMVQKYTFSVTPQATDFDPASILINVNGNRFEVLVNASSSTDLPTVATYAALQTVQATLAAGVYRVYIVLVDSNDLDPNTGIGRRNVYVISSTTADRIATI